jgi:hypothetical protein
VNPLLCFCAKVASSTFYDKNLFKIITLAPLDFAHSDCGPVFEFGAEREKKTSGRKCKTSKSIAGNALPVEHLKQKYETPRDAGADSTKKLVILFYTKY